MGHNRDEGKDGAIRSLAVSALLIVASGGAHSAGLDCSKAASSVDHIICDDSELRAKDKLLSKIYTAVLSQDNDGTVQTEQQNWIAKTQACGDARCVKEQYDNKLYKLMTRKASSSAGHSYSQSVQFNTGASYQGSLVVGVPMDGFAAISISGTFTGPGAATNGDVNASGLEGVATMKGSRGQMDDGEGCVVTLRRFGRHAWRVNVTRRCAQLQAAGVNLEGVYRRDPPPTLK